MGKKRRALDVHPPCGREARRVCYQQQCKKQRRWQGIFRKISAAKCFLLRGGRAKRQNSFSQKQTSVLGHLGVKGVFEFAEGGAVGGFAAEELDDFDGGAEVAEGIDFEGLHGLDGLDAAVGVFLEEGFEDGAGLLAVFAEEVALGHPGGAFAAGEGRLVVGDVADEVEGVVIGSDPGGQLVEEEALRGKFVEECFLLVGGVPLVEKVVEGGVGPVDGLGL